MRRSWRCPNCGDEIDLRTVNHADTCRGKPRDVLFAPPPPPRGKPVYLPMGCICPPTSEATCANPLCPRKNPMAQGESGLSRAPAEQVQGQGEK